jgi:metal-responsive CopG/Arc/MetJ family transcriptional regulator
MEKGVEKGRVSLNLSPELYGRFEEARKRMGLSRNALARLAIAHFLHALETGEIKLA